MSKTIGKFAKGNDVADMMKILYAHSSDLARGVPVQTYKDHVDGVVERSVRYARMATRFFSKNAADFFIREVILSAVYHDFAKLHPKNQPVLGMDGNHGHLPIHHTDGAVKLLLLLREFVSAFICGSHHSHLPDVPKELQRKGNRFRDDSPVNPLHPDYLTRQAVDTAYPQMRADHDSVIDTVIPPLPLLTPEELLLTRSDLAARMHLSCLVRADHEDTASHYKNDVTVPAFDLRWDQRIAKLDAYVKELSDKAPDGLRKDIRNLLYNECSHSPLSVLAYINALVGSGKTVSFMKYALRLAQARNRDRIFIIQPLTAIISQTVKAYRKSIVLPGEKGKEIIGENHHNVVYDSPKYRHLTSSWNNPVVVTTSVQFFDAISGSRTSELKKLHMLANSVVVIDEIHADFRPYQWDQFMRWMKELNEHYGVDFIFASGTLGNMWEDPTICPHSYTTDFKGVVSKALADKMAFCEKSRIEYVAPKKGEKLDLYGTAQRLTTAKGPVLMVAATRKNAYLIACYLKLMGKEAYHLSTVLSPSDRELIIDQVTTRLEDKTQNDWYLVSTSCIESGVDVSFRTGFMEFSSIISMYQVGGRINRNCEYGLCQLYLLNIYDDDATRNDALQVEKSSIWSIICSYQLNGDMYTNIRQAFEDLFWTGNVEVKDGADEKKTILYKHHEASEVIYDQAKKGVQCNFPLVSQLSKTLLSMSTTVVVDTAVIDKIRRGEKVTNTEVSRGSITLLPNQMKEYNNSIDSLGVDGEIKVWTGKYDGGFAGIFGA